MSPAVLVVALGAAALVGAAALAGGKKKKPAVDAATLEAVLRAATQPHSNQELVALRTANKWEKLTLALRENNAWFRKMHPNAAPFATDGLSHLSISSRPPDPHMDPFGSPVDEFARFQTGAGPNPLEAMFDVALVGVALIPGWGLPVSVGLRAAYELGKGRSVSDAGLAALRQGLPPGPSQAAFDAGVGIASGQAPINVIQNVGASQVPPQYQGYYRLGVNAVRTGAWKG
jgi:hypothetical protein